MIVLDASAAFELVANRPLGRLVEPRIRDDEIHAPHLVDLEVTQVLRRLVASARLDEDRALLALASWRALLVVRHAHDGFLPRIWTLRGNLTAYDAVYVALAESMDAPLITCDARLATAPGHQATVELIA